MHQSASHPDALYHAIKYREALVEIAEGRHHLNRPAGAIAKAALADLPLPPMHPCPECRGTGKRLYGSPEMQTCRACGGYGEEAGR